MGRPKDGEPPSRRPRRARGEGSIWQDKKTGRWWYAISINGKQHKYRAPDKQTAAARLKQLKEEQDYGVVPSAGRVTLGDHCQGWMEKIVVNLKPKTKRFYKQITEHYLLPYLGEREPIKRIAAEHIIDMLNAMRRAGYAEQTIDHVFTVGKTVFAYARKWRRIMFNPFDDVDPPNVKTIDPTPLSEAEAWALRGSVEDHRLRALYELALVLGLRKGELLGLTIAGLDLKAATITISQQVLDLDEGPSIEPYTKNDEARTLPVTPRLVALLKIRLTQLLAESECDSWEEHGLLFPSERGTPMSERNLDRHFKASCVKVQIRLRDTGKKRANGTPILTSDLKFHHLRHTCLSWLGDAGASDKILKAIAGHADSDVTDRYVHVSLAAMREVVERMEAARFSRDAGNDAAAQAAGEKG
jgi:integrase